ncbi:acid resistance serine protease MarP [Ornithinibacter aureus]|uniref:Acid resistance serine protease MarP n=1 Tax=Ornithinibacter aureus TaxID=622664 RepID=A0ABP8JEW1_9MICO|nr:MarP family serine protease [Ornithinibacter aureus]KAF0834078.1 colicin V production protein [Ornithinibacter aureus]
MSGSAGLDLLLVMLLLAYAWSGWRQGFVSALLGLAGLVGGAFVAVRVAPGVIEDHLGHSVGTSSGLAFLVLSVLVCAALGQVLMLQIGRRLRESIDVPVARALDSALGSIAVLVAAALVMWVVASAVRAGGPSIARDLVEGSTVARALDTLVPSSADGLVEDVTEALDRQGFPRVFDGAGPEPISSVEAPDPTVADDPNVRRALRSVIHVRAESQTCDRGQVGSGWVVSPGRVATNAHVVAGAERVRVRVGDRGRERSARVVAFDPRRDVAVLAVEGLRAPALQVGAPLEAGAAAVVAGFPGDDGLWVDGARVRDVITARGADIYSTSSVVREVYSLRAQVRRGASGGPLLDPTGAVVGMIFATSLDDPDTGYALTLDEISGVLAQGGPNAVPVSTGRCAAG